MDPVNYSLLKLKLNLYLFFKRKNLDVKISQGLKRIIEDNTKPKINNYMSCY